MDTQIQKDIEEALDGLRDATVNRDYVRADKLKAALLAFLNPAGYTLVEDTKKIYIIKKIADKPTGVS